MDINGRSLGPAAVAWYKAEGNTLGTLGFSGTAGSGVSYGPGEVGQAFQFDGTTNGIVNLIDPPTITSNQLTIEGWIFQTDPSQTNNGIGAQTIFDDLTNTQFNLGYLLRTVNGVLSLRLVTLVGGVTVTAPSALPVNTWVHVAAVYNGSTVRLFQNGVQVASTAASGTLASGGDESAIGNDTGGGLSGFKGKIDELTVYARALDTDELSEIVGFGSTGKANPLGNGASGIFDNLAPGTTIGGTAAGAGNVISGNARAGVSITGNNVLVAGNLIGTNPAGTLVVPNNGDGVDIASGSGTTIGGSSSGAGNLISGDIGSGISVGTAAVSVLAAGNLIGLNAAGSSGAGRSIHRGS